MDAGRRDLCLLVVLVAVLGHCVGCGAADGAKVSGTVKLQNGQPVVKARVTVRNDATGEWASGITNSEGFYSLGKESTSERLSSGEYRVTIIEDQGDWDHPSPPKISNKYTRPETSDLLLKVESGGSQTLDIVVDPA